MPSLHDIYCGRQLVKHNIVSVKAMWGSLQRLAAHQQDGRIVSLVEDLRREGHITNRHVRKLKQATDRHQALLREKMLAQIVLEHQLVDRTILKSLVDSQRNDNFMQGLGPMLIAQDLISQSALQKIQAEQAVRFAQMLTDKETAFNDEITSLAAPFNNEQERRVLEALGLGGDRKTRTTNLFTRQEAQALLTEDPKPASQEPARGEDDASLYESSDNAFNSQRILAAVDDSHLKKAEECPIYGYEIVKELGQGAMGVVYKARHIFTDRLTALKVLPLRLAKDGQYLERFKREAIACMRLQHDNIVRAYDFGGSEDYYYLALEFIDGETLEETLERDGAIPEETCMRYAHGLAQGLDFAWSLKVLHRDIKPENIMITKDGDAKLCDFGIVKLVDMEDEAAVTMAGTTVGTPYYISPEQARGADDLDIRSDIYSFGITLWHALTGQVPFTGKSQGAILVRHILEAVPDPRTAKPELNPKVADIINKMIAKKREDRFQTPADIAAEIEKHFPQG